MYIGLTNPVTQSDIPEDLNSQETAEETSKTLMINCVNVLDN